MNHRCFVTFMLLSLLLLPTLPSTAVEFDAYFLDKTMRMDYFHTGIKDVEIISLDNVYEEPALPSFSRQMWAGNTVNLIDTLNLGKHHVKVYDAESKTLIFSRGYSSVFGEWQTTDEAAKGMYRTFHETVLFPFPKNPVTVVIATRDKENVFRDVFSTTIDPASRFVNRERHCPTLNVRAIQKSGDPHKKVDLLILGDGYSIDEMKLLEKDVSKFTETLFNARPFKENRDAFNVWMIEAPSLDSGIDEPLQNKWRRTSFGCSFNSFDLARYVLTLENKAIRDIASLAPYDQIYFIVNSNQYGGGGIYNLYSTCYARDEGKNSGWWPDYVFVHEFGHAFGGLGDEYYNSSVAYNEFYPLGVDPWEPNVGIITDGHIKWEHMMESDTPIPTPWNKAKYDSLTLALQTIDRSAADYREQYQRILGQRDEVYANQKYAGKVGAFEGSGYASEGLYRPYLDCRMFSKSLVEFCPVCQKSIEKVIEFHTR